jgi:glyceraldehyde 3-phosphate dehydrogenase
MKIGINGLGRIGRLTFRAAIERGDAQIMAINTSTPIEHLAHLIKYDSTHGQAEFDIKIEDNALLIQRFDYVHRVEILSHKSPADIPWSEYGVEVVLECSGRFNTKALAAGHLRSGVNKVVVSAPCQDADATIVLGVNDEMLNDSLNIISIASCTTNALAPIVKILHQKFGIESGYATTVHSYTFDQNILDNYHDDVRRARSAHLSIIPTKSGVSSSLKLVMPEIGNKISGSAIRVPTPNVSLVDFCFKSMIQVNKEQVNHAVIDAVAYDMRHIVSVASEPLVSIDFNHNFFSSIFDPFETQVVNKDFVRVLFWYDNEWAFSNRMIDVAKLFNQINK